jgi:hypothetical protein
MAIREEEEIDESVAEAAIKRAEDAMKTNASTKRVMPPVQAALKISGSTAGPNAAAWADLLRGRNRSAYLQRIRRIR